MRARAWTSERSCDSAPIWIVVALAACGRPPAPPDSRPRVTNVSEVEAASAAAGASSVSMVRTSSGPLRRLAGFAPRPDDEVRARNTTFPGTYCPLADVQDALEGRPRLRAVLELPRTDVSAVALALQKPLRSVGLGLMKCGSDRLLVTGRGYRVETLVDALRALDGGWTTLDEVRRLVDGWTGVRRSPLRDPGT